MRVQGGTGVQVEPEEMEEQMLVAMVAKVGEAVMEEGRGWM
jgi:hypothetical protein